MNRQRQLQLWNQETLNVGRELAEALNQAARRSNLSREQIVDQMNALAGKYGISLASGNGARLSTANLEKWINPNDDRQMPIKALPVFCAVTGDSEPLDILARPLGLRVIGNEEQTLLRWAKANLAQRQARREMRELEEQLDI